MGAKLVEMIEVEVMRGNGKETPIRRVLQWYTPDGTFMAERDDLADLAIAKVIGQGYAPTPEQRAVLLEGER